MTNYLKRHWVILLLCVLFGSLATILIGNWFSYQLNPDGVSYISIAQKYASGDFKHAINGYWAPLLPLLMVPGIWLNIEPIIVAKLVLAASSVVMLLAVYTFLERRKVARSITYICCAALAITMLPWVTYEPITPDVLLATLIVIFAMRLIDFMAKPSRNQALLLGVIGALMYFAKGFGFFLFIGVVGLVALWQWRWQDKQWLVVVRRYLPMAIVFFALVLPFIGLLTVKYHALTINNAGEFDHRMYGYYGLRKGNFPPVVLKDGQLMPLPPPNDSAVNAWEDPSYLIPLARDWNIVGSWDYFVFYFNHVIGTNMNITFEYVYKNGPLLTLGFGAIAIGWLQRRYYRREFAVFALISFLAMTGYVLVFAEGRYLWAMVAMGTMSIGLWASTMQKRQVLTRAQIIVGGLILCGAIITSVSQNSIARYDTDLRSYRIAQKVGQYIPKDSKILADAFIPSYHTCYHAHLKCYNVMHPTPWDEPSYYRLIEQQGISYYINYHTRDTDEILNHFTGTYFREVYNGKVDGQLITIYRLQR